MVTVPPRSLSIYLIIAAPMMINAASVDAKTRAVQDIRVEVDGKPFKVVKYDDGTVMVVQRTLGGHRPDQEFRERSRRAVIKATGCRLADELLDPFNIHYTGRLECPATAADEPSKPAQSSTP